MLLARSELLTENFLVPVTARIAGRGSWCQLADWAGVLGWSGFGNLAGGIGLVTSLRVLQTPQRVAEERDGQS